MIKKINLEFGPNIKNYTSLVQGYSRAKNSFMCEKLFREL